MEEKELSNLDETYVEKDDIEINEQISDEPDQAYAVTETIEEPETIEEEKEEVVVKKLSNKELKKRLSSVEYRRYLRSGMLP